MIKYMWTELKTMIKTVTPAQAATHELLHAEHDLLKAEAGVEYAQAMVTCQKQRIKRLKAYLALDEAKEPA
jgi:hypothetical protein